MNRRAFITKLTTAVLGAPLAARYAPPLLSKVAPPLPQIPISPVWSDYWVNETARISAVIAKTVARQSPYVSLLETGVFPEGVGDTVRVTTQGKCQA